MIDQVVSKGVGAVVRTSTLCGSKTNILLDHVSMQLCGQEQDSWYQGVPLLQPDSQP
jgi:hypothetical protein